MSVDSKVSVFHNGITGAPAVTAGAGSVAAILDACLVDGFGLATMTSLVVTGGIAVATFPGAHSAAADRIMLVEGATPSGLNGRWRMTSTTVNTATFAVTGVADGTATGTITMKVAPLGWTREFTGTNLRVYRSANVDSTQFYLRIDDTATNTARAVGYETMTDVSTGSGPFPTSAQVSGGMVWAHRSSRWFLVGDDVRFYFGVTGRSADSGNGHAISMFGDFVSYKPSNAYRCALFGPTSDSLGAAAINASEMGAWANSSITGYGARGYSGLGGSEAIGRIASPWFGSTNWSGISSSGYPYPDPITNSLRLSNALVSDGGGVLGYLPGIYPLIQALGEAQANAASIDGQGDLLNRKLTFFATGAYSGAINPGSICFDTTGPWEY